MKNTINPADAKPGEVYEGTAEGERWTLQRLAPGCALPWRGMPRDPHLTEYPVEGTWFSDPGVSDLQRLVPASPVTRKDLPSIPHVFGNERNGADKYREAVIEYLNAIGGVAADDARWRRAHEIVERERDQARDERDKWEEKYLDTDEALHRARASLHEACKVAQSYKVDAYQATERAEAAEARTAPAVSRADVAEALSRCINPEMWNVTFPSVVSEVCDLFGVEAEQAVDPLLDKAQEFAALADWELTDREAELLHTVAAHVLGQEGRHVDQ